MRELALFAGAGGGILGGKLLGWRTVCAVERDAYAAQVLAQRQNDGILRPFPIWSDVTTFDGRPWRGIVDVISGGFPCQDISAAGKGAGITGARSGLWKEMVRIIGEVRPIEVRVENSPMLTTRGLGVVLGDLAALGFDAEWGVLSAADVGANHERERIWIVAKQPDIFSYPEHDRHRWGKQQQEGAEKAFRAVADPNMQHDKRWGESQQPTSDCRKKWNQLGGGSNESNEVSNPNSTQRQRVCESVRVHQERSDISDARWWQTEPNVGRVADGVAFAMDRLKAIGNGQVPLCAATAFELLRDRLNDN